MYYRIQHTVQTQHWAPHWLFTEFIVITTVPIGPLPSDENPTCLDYAHVYILPCATKSSFEFFWPTDWIELFWVMRIIVGTKRGLMITSNYNFNYSTTYVGLYTTWGKVMVQVPTLGQNSHLKSVIYSIRNKHLVGGNRDLLQVLKKILSLFLIRKYHFTVMWNSKLKGEFSQRNIILPVSK